MADMTLRLMLDDTNLSVEAPHAASAYAIAGYVNGRFNNWASVVAKWGKSGKYLLSIDVLNQPSAGAQCLDVEPGDATNADAPSWVKATQAAGRAAKDLRYYPKLYTSASNATALIGALTAAGIARNEYMLWTAHYTGKAHICNSSCGLGNFQADATQWTDTYQGASLDATQAYGYFFAGAPAQSTGWAYPAPGKVSIGQGNATFPIEWEAVAHNGVAAKDYQLQILDVNGHTFQEFAVAGTSRTVTLPRGTYTARVWADGGPDAPPHTDFKFTV